MRVLLVALLTLVAPAAISQVTSVGVGGTAVCAATAGAVKCWGDGAVGLLGDGNANPHTALVPASALVVTSGFTGVGAGDTHMCAVNSPGEVFCWGANQRGQLGNGSVFNTATPTKALRFCVSGLSGCTTAAATVSGGQAHSCALTQAGGAKCWGSNQQGQLGNNNQGIGDTAAVDVLGLTSGVRMVSAGGNSACAVTTAGALRCWGANDNNQIGDGGAITTRPSPVTVLASGAASVSIGPRHACAVTTTGGVKCWGTNFNGQLGDGTTTTRATPVDVSGLTSGVASVSVGGNHTCAVTTGGGVRCWGNNATRQLGDGTSVTQSLVPVNVSGLSTGATAVEAGGIAGTTCAIMNDASLRCWGDNQTGQIGDGSAATPRPTPVTTIAAPAPPPVGLNLNPAPVVEMGEVHACALHATGAVSCWGENASGQLGNGTTNDRTTPGSVAMTAARLSAGGNHTCVLNGAGAASCWGANGSGQLGDGSRTNRAAPFGAAALSGAYTQIRGGATHTCALTSSGTVQCVGGNAAGQLGNATFADSLAAVNVANLSGATEVRTGNAHNCALAGGAVACWGDNRFGQLGDGTNTNRSVPGPVSGLSGGVTAIAAGGDHSCALRTGGAVVCWGRNDLGQLGDGTQAHRAAPVNVVGFSSGVQGVEAGGFHTCARLANGAASCWGFNNFGQLGDGTKVTRTQPSGVNDLNALVASVATGAGASCALMNDGGVRCWGENGSGQLGVGTLAERSTPLQVLGLNATGYLDLTPADGVTVPVAIAPTITVVTAGSATGPVANVAATVTVRPEDRAVPQNVYVYAIAPANLVLGAAGDPLPSLFAKTSAGKDAPVGCRVAELNAAGQLVAKDINNLTSKGNTTAGSTTVPVSILNGVPTGSLAGSTFFVGYGTTSANMADKGNTTSVVNVPGPVTCKVAAGQRGWWWNPAEGGRGFSIETQGDRLFFAAFLYDPDGRASWLVSSGKTTLDGASYTQPLLRFTGGQTLGGGYVAPAAPTTVGTLNLTFNTATTATLVWPGGTIPIERFNITQNGLAAPPQDNVPESGWWWNELERGRGFFIEFQGGFVDIAGYMYDATGQPVWYLSVIPVANPRSWTSNWWLYANGQSLLAPYRQATRITDTFAPLSITFDSAETATLNLPNGLSTRLVRHRF